MSSMWNVGATYLIYVQELILVLSKLVSNSHTINVKKCKIASSISCLIVSNIFIVFYHLNCTNKVLVDLFKGRSKKRWVRMHASYDSGYKEGMLTFFSFHL